MPPRPKRAAAQAGRVDAKKPSGIVKPVGAKPRATKKDHVPEPDPHGLNEINGIKPKVLLADGETLEAASQSSSSKYTLKRTMDHYYCNCPAWRNAGGAVNARTCKHLMAALGGQYEEARLERADPGSSQKFTKGTTKGTTKKAAATTTTRKRKAVAPPAADAEDEEDDEDDGSETTGAARTKRKAPAPKRLKDEAAVKFKPLLAEKWDVDGGRDPTGYLVSEKLDGVRAVWDGPAGEFRSREGNRFFAPAWFTAKLPRDVTLDGELWTARGGFQDCVAIVKAQNAPDRWKFSVTFQAFDVPSMGDQPFEARLAFLRGLFRGRKACRWVNVLEHTVARSRAHVLAMLDDVCADGGEGLMLREPASPYVNGRSKTLLKVKRFFDADAVVRAHERGSGKNANCTGALRCEMVDEQGTPTGKMFKVGTGLTDAQRRSPPKVGATIIYRYQELTRDGVPRFPSYQGERAD